MFKKQFIGLNNMRIRNKLIIVFLVVVCLPILFVGLFLTIRMKTMALNQSFSEAEIEVARVTNSVEELVELNVNIMNSLFADGRMFEVANNRYDTTLEVFEYFNSYKQIEIYENMYQQIADVRVYVDNDTILDNLDFMKVTDEVREKHWYQQSILWEGKIFATYFYDNISNTNYLMLAKSLKMSNGKKMVITSLSSLKEIYSFIENERFDIQILDSKSNILASTELSDMYKNLYDVAGMYIREKDVTWRDIYKGKLSQLFMDKVSYDQMVIPIYIVSAVPVNEILKEANAASNLGLFVMFGSMGLAAILIIAFSDLLTKRISHLVTEIRVVARGEFNQMTVYEEEDEIGILSRNLYSMSQSLSKLMDENIKSKEKEKELLIASERMKFEVLSSQVNPHFLFNVLESLRMKAHINGEIEVAKGIKNLGILMRRSLEMTTDLVTVEEEIDFIRYYIELQRFRFGERIQYNIDISEEANTLKVLPLIIQPLVENAMVHGIESRSERGRISITGNVMYSLNREKELVISIHDNGGGIDKKRLHRINQQFEERNYKWSDDGRKHIGIVNIYERIKNYYGEEAGLTITSRTDEQHQTQVILRIPINNKNNEIEEM